MAHNARVESPAAATRARAFLRSVDEMASERFGELTYGMGYWNAGTPKVHEHTNFIRVAPGIGARALAGLTTEAEHEQGVAGLQHRKLVYDDDNSRQIAQLLRPLGWQVRNLVLMAYEGRPWAPPPGHALTELDVAEAREARLSHMQAAGGLDDEAMQQRLVHDDRIAQSATVRWFAAYAGHDPVSVCGMWSDGQTAQIDSLSTLQAHRRRGHAKAVLAAALYAAAPEHKLVFLLTQENHWTSRWFERLGFEQVGFRFEAVQVAGATRA